MTGKKERPVIGRQNALDIAMGKTRPVEPWVPGKGIVDIIKGMFNLPKPPPKSNK